MDLSKIIADLKDCPCGKVHTTATEVVEIGSGMTARVGEILAKANFPREILALADENTAKASEGIFESLSASGFKVKKLIYPDMKYARVEQVREVTALSADVGGILSIGTGSLGDICPLQD